MSRSMEDLLRDAYQARTAQLTEHRLDQLTADREQNLDALLAEQPLPGDTAPIELPVGHVAEGRRHRWLAPAIAAAVVAALAAGGLGLANRHEQHARPVAPASTPAPTPTPSAASSTASAAPTGSSSPTAVTPPYLAAGQTGTRDQVPWSHVGPGWQLLQPLSADPAESNPVLYLYDPAGGRYLITDSLPTGGHLVGWSSDGDRAMVEARQAMPEALYQVDLHSGSAVPVLHSSQKADFVTYTRPNGQAFLVGTATDLLRYGVDGSLQFTYPRTVNGIDLSTSQAIYSADGSELVRMNDADGSPVLVGNDGHFIRTFVPPAGFARCTAVRLWPDGRLLERCALAGSGQAQNALVLQSLSGGAPQVLANVPEANGSLAWDGWKLSNGDVLISNWADCGDSSYDVLDAATGATRPFQWPADLPRGAVQSVSGDVATFRYKTPRGCGNSPYRFETYSYHLLTGAVTKLVDGQATVLPWPGS